VTDEAMLRKRASHWRGVLTESGYLFLDPKRLVFMPDRFDIQEKRLEIDLRDIDEVIKMDIGLSNEMHLKLKDGRRERFVVSGRDGFVDALKRQMAHKQ